MSNGSRRDLGTVVTVIPNTAPVSLIHFFEGGHYLRHVIVAWRIESGDQSDHENDYVDKCVPIILEGNAENELYCLEEQTGDGTRFVFGRSSFCTFASAHEYARKILDDPSTTFQLTTKGKETQSRGD
jgi:hypothetical protein